MAKPSLLDAVASGVACMKPWPDRLPKDAMAELHTVRERYRKGTLGTRPYLVARLAIEAGKENGWDMPSEKVLALWLQSDS